MDKINNIKTAVAATALNAGNSRDLQSLEGKSVFCA